MGSQAVKLMSEQQIASIGEDLQYFWQILMSRKPKIRPNSDPVPSALTLYFTTSATVRYWRTKSSSNNNGEN